MGRPYSTSSLPARPTTGGPPRRSANWAARVEWHDADETTADGLAAIAETLEPYRAAVGREHEPVRASACPLPRCEHPAPGHRHGDAPGTRRRAGDRPPLRPLGVEVPDEETFAARAAKPTIPAARRVRRDRRPLPAARPRTRHTARLPAGGGRDSVRVDADALAGRGVGREVGAHQARTPKEGDTEGPKSRPQRVLCGVTSPGPFAYSPAEGEHDGSTAGYRATMQRSRV